MIPISEAMKVLAEMHEQLVQREAHYSQGGGSTGKAAADLGWIRDRHESLALAIAAMKAQHKLP